MRYTYGKEYIELADEIDLEESTYIRLQTPDSALIASILPSYTVSFESGGGNPILPKANVMQGLRISSPIAPMRSGYTFEGWYKESSLVNKWDFSRDVVVADMTLYAKWTFPSSIPLKYVKGGTFQMGTAGDYFERPHRVTVDSFFMGTYEVTQDIYQQVMGSNPSKWKGARLPVEQVTWYEAVAFCNALSRRDGLQEVYMIEGKMVSCDWSKRGYRLPTEAEWEFAARGGNLSKGYTYAGSNIAEDVAWYRDNISWKTTDFKTHDVGGKRANELGLYDMSGNVQEWCWDWIRGYSAEEQTNPTGPSLGEFRVSRGGSWISFEEDLRSANRWNNGIPSHRIDFVGFRLVLPAQ